MPHTQRVRAGVLGLTYIVLEFSLFFNNVRLGLLNIVASAFTGFWHVALEFL